MQIKKTIRVSSVFLFFSIILLTLLFLSGCNSNSQASLTYTVDSELDYSQCENVTNETSLSAEAAIVQHDDQMLSQMDGIFKRENVDIRDYGAESHAEFPLVANTYKKSTADAGAETALAKKNTKAIYAAICAVSGKGGGTVTVPADGGKVFYTSAIHLEDNVNLNIEAGATLKFTTDYSLYEGNLMKEVYGNGVDDQGLTFTRYESVELMNYSPLIYAYGKKNIAITGQGTLDGSASLGDGVHPETMTWHEWKYKRTYANGVTIEAQDAPRTKLFGMGQKNIDVSKRQFGGSSSDPWSGADDGFLRPTFIQPYNCQNVLIQNVSIKNSPMWEINPVLCDSIVMEGTTVDTHLTNNDGCDPECCSNFIIRNNVIDVGDDCIAIKSGRNGDGLRINRPTYNVVITGNTFKDGHGGITIGSEITSGVSNVYSENNKMESNQLEAGYRFKTNYIRGGTIKNIFYRNDTVHMVKDTQPIVLVDLNYDINNEVKRMEAVGVSYKAYMPKFNNVYIDGLNANPDSNPNSGGKTAFEIRGFSKDKIADSCKVDANTEDCYVTGFHVSNSTLNMSTIAFNCAYVREIEFNNVEINGTTSKSTFENCRSLWFNNCRFNNCDITQSDLEQVEDCHIENCTF